MQRHPLGRPKLVGIDLPPYATTQAPDRDGFLSIWDFSDPVFSVIPAFLSGDSGRSVAELESVEV